MPLAEDMKNIAENIISSYETRIQNIGAIFGTTHQLLEGLQDSFLDTREEQGRINAELRENLAKNGSLRRKDFNNMMQGILSAQDQREKIIRNLLKDYFNEQRLMAQALRKNLGKFKDSLARGEAERVKEFHDTIKEILAKQDKRKDEVTSKLKEFQKEQEVLATRLKELLAKGRELRIRDLKLMLKEFNAQHKERIARQQERQKSVRDMLGDFKKERKEAAKSWRTIRRSVQRKAQSPAAVKIDTRGSSSKKAKSQNL